MHGPGRGGLTGPGACGHDWQATFLHGLNLIDEHQHLLQLLGWRMRFVRTRRWVLCPDTVPLPEFLHKALQGGRAVDRPFEIGLPVLGERLAINSPSE